MIKQTLAIAIIGCAIDQWTKFMARLFLRQGSIHLGVIDLDLVFNTGTAYGLFSNFTVWLTWLGVAVLVYLFAQLRNLVNCSFDTIVFGALLAGGIGNTIDRLVFGMVTDFINIHIIPVFNFADIFLNIGLYGLIIQWVFFRNNSTKSSG